MHTRRGMCATIILHAVRYLVFLFLPAGSVWYAVHRSSPPKAANDRKGTTFEPAICAYTRVLNYAITQFVCAHIAHASSFIIYASRAWCCRYSPLKCLVESICYSIASCSVLHKCCCNCNTIGTQEVSVHWYRHYDIQEVHSVIVLLVHCNE